MRSEGNTGQPCRCGTLSDHVIRQFVHFLPAPLLHSGSLRSQGASQAALLHPGPVGTSLYMRTHNNPNSHSNKKSLLARDATHVHAHTHRDVTKCAQCAEDGSSLFSSKHALSDYSMNHWNIQQNNRLPKYSIAAALFYSCCIDTFCTRTVSNT